MQETAQSQKKSNIPMIVAVALVVACICGCVTLALTTGIGFYLLDFSSVTNAPVLLTSEPELTNEPGQPDPTATEEEPYDPNLPQGGLGNNALRKRVWDFVIPMAEKDANCESPLPAAAVVVVTKEPDSSGYWEEGWTLFCENGPTPVFRIVFTPNPDGTINFSPGIISK